MEMHVASTVYSVPTYRAPSDAIWHHFLHGNVPGHQIDFMYRPELPSGQLSQQHFSHLARLVKYIEPRRGSSCAFAIGNLSRDDTQYEPGHGAIALIFGLRIQGATDHAGRQDPPFCYASAIVDRHLDEWLIHAATTAFHTKFLSKRNGATEGNAFYHDYLRLGQHPTLLQSLLQRYVGEFNGLPALPRSQLSLRWTVEGTTPPKRVTIVHPNHVPFDTIAACAARIAAVLVESDIRWTCIATGREADIAGGMTVRFVPESDVAGESHGGSEIRFDEVPENLAELAAKLFGARDTQRHAIAHVGWRQAIAVQTIQMNDPVVDEIPISVRNAESTDTAPVSKRRAHTTRKRIGLLIGAVAAFAVAGILLAIGLGIRDATPLAKPTPTTPLPDLEVQAQSTPIVVDAPAMPLPTAEKAPTTPRAGTIPTVARKEHDGEKKRAVQKNTATEKKDESAKFFNMLPPTN